MISIMNYRDYNHPIDPKELFGDDAELVSETCIEIFRKKLYPYEECYRSPDRPHLKDYCCFSDGHFKMDIASFKSASAAWEMANPFELQKEKASRAQWTARNAQLFSTLYDIMLRHELIVDWCGTGGGPCEPDRFIIMSKDGTTRIGMIQC